MTDRHEGCPVCAAQKRRNKSTDKPSAETLARLERLPRGEPTFIQPPGEPIKIVDGPDGTEV